MPKLLPIQTPISGWGCLCLSCFDRAHNCKRYRMQEDKHNGSRTSCVSTVESINMSTQICQADLSSALQFPLPRKVVRRDVPASVLPLVSPVERVYEVLFLQLECIRQLERHTDRDLWLQHNERGQTYKCS